MWNPHTLFGYPRKPRHARRNLSGTLSRERNSAVSGTAPTRRDRLRIHLRFARTSDGIGTSILASARDCKLASPVGRGLNSYSPPFEGGVDATSRKYCEASLLGADG